MAKVIACSNQKGGVGKTTTVTNLGIGLARKGKKVLLIDADSQGSLTVSLGYGVPDQIDRTLASVLGMIINDDEFEWDYGILHHKEGVDFLPGNIELSGLEVTLTSVMSRESIMRQYVDRLRDRYDFIIIDCMPSLGMLTINALTCADMVLIPVQAAYLPLRGLEQLLKTIGKIKRSLNPKLSIAGILITMVDRRTNNGKDITNLIHNTYGDKIHIYANVIPLSVRAAEMPIVGCSIFYYDEKCTVAVAYEALTEEVLNNE